MIDLENAYQWLNLDFQSALRPPMRILRQELHKRLEQGDIVRARQLIDRMSALGTLYQDSDEKAEVMVECGRAYYFLDEFTRAVPFLQDASRYYHARQHNLAVTLWMNGWVMWQMKSHQEEAVDAWQRSYNIFKSLAGSYDSLQKKTTWYTQRCTEMQASIAEAVATW